MATSVEFVIVGQGLAGTALAWELIWRGREVLVVDPGDEVTSSRIAAGLVTPITGQRLALGWRVDEMLAAARPFYDRVAEELGAVHFHPRVVRRIFRDAAEAALWEKRRHDPARHRYIGRAHVPEAGRFGGCELIGAQLDTAGYLAASRAAFCRLGALRESRMDPEEAAGWPARRVVFCQGFEAAQNPYFSWIRWRAAKGEILTLRLPGLDRETIRSAGQWLAPDPSGPQRDSGGWGTARTGSTYDWDTLDTRPTEEARAVLEAGVSALYGGPFEVIAHRAAVRPIICESRAVIGIHPGREKLAFFNGLGSKGSLHGPFFARQLAGHLADGDPIEESSDLRRNIG